MAPTPTSLYEQEIRESRRREDDYWKGEVAARLKAMEDTFGKELHNIKELLDREMTHQARRVIDLEGRMATVERELGKIYTKVAVLATVLGVLGAKLSGFIHDL